MTWPPSPAGCLGEHLPRRDLWISPHHAMYFAETTGTGVLVEAKDLINGTTIRQADDVDQVEYFHVELDSHDVLLAEGAPSESFVDDQSRGMFHNAHTFQDIYPGEHRVEALYCAPRVEDGYAFEAICRRIAERAGLSAPAACVSGRLRGNIDRCELGRDGLLVSGWAQNEAYPDAAVCLDIVVDGRVAGLAYANKYRDDLERAGIGNGRHAFSIRIVRNFALAGVVEVRRSADNVALGSTKITVSKPVAA